MAIHEKILNEVNEYLSCENYDKALALLRPMVKLHIPEAMGMYGLMYQSGYGVSRDIPKAIEFLTKAYEMGDGLAAHHLGTIYATGEADIEKDPDKSKMYYRKAKELGAQYAPDEFYE